MLNIKQFDLPLNSVCFSLKTNINDFMCCSVEGMNI